MNSCEMAKDVQKKLKELRSLLFISSEREKLRRIELEKDIQVEYERLRRQCGNSIYDFRQPSIVIFGEIDVKYVDLMIEAVERYIGTHCPE